MKKTIIIIKKKTDDNINIKKVTEDKVKIIPPEPEKTEEPTFEFIPEKAKKNL